MKNTVLIIWNVVLTAFAIFILIHILSERGEHEKKNEGKPSEKVAATIDSTSNIRIAYVNIDTLEDHYELFAQKKKELEAKQKQSEDLLNKKMDDFQNDYTAAQQAA